MNKKDRLFGIDIFRGLAVYAVILLHVDEGIASPPGQWEAIIHFSSFAVPFFLAASFYLSVGKLYADRSSYSLPLRLTRLLTPYVFWSIVYLLYKSLKYFIDKDFGQLNKLFEDPIALFFLGGAAFHLYFLPLLIVGTVSVKASEYLIKNPVQLKVIVILFGLSLASYELVLRSGNSFESASSIAFGPFLVFYFPGMTENFVVRLLAVEIAWVIRCLPYILLAMIIWHPKLDQVRNIVAQVSPLLLVVFLLVNAFGNQFLFGALYEAARGYLALFLAIALSPYLKSHPLLSSIGTCSFGIYLIHLLFVEMFYIVDNRLKLQILSHPSTLTLLAFSSLVLVLSWVLTSLLLKFKPSAKLMFGV